MSHPHAPATPVPAPAAAAATTIRNAFITAALLVTVGLSGCVALPPSTSVTQPASSEPATEAEPESEPGSEVAPSATPTGVDPPAAEQGSRDNPWHPGDQLFTDDWELVVGATNLDANAIVADGNMFNDVPEPGFQYIQVPVSVTYVGAESSSTFDIQVAYVSASGETYESWDVLVAVPDDNDGQELYTGGTASFSEYLMVPSDGVADGLLRLQVGTFGGAEGWVTLA